MLPKMIDFGIDMLQLVSESPIRYESWEFFVEFDSEEKFNEWLSSRQAKGLSYRVL